MWGLMVPPGNTTNISIRNNIIMNFNYTPVYVGNTPNAADNVSITNNIFYNNGNNNDIRGNSTLTHYDNSSNLKVNPLFVDYANSNFHLQSSSSAIGNGIDVGLVTDYEGVLYATPPSIGAYEYVP